MELDDSDATSTSWFIPRIAADGTTDDSWPFRSGISLTGFKNCRMLMDMMILSRTLHTAMRQYVIKLYFMYFIIQCKIISRNKFSFLGKNENILTTK